MKLLVVGGGMGGVAAIVGLRKKDKETEIVLVEPKDYCEICWASYRTPFDQKLAKSAMCPLDEFCEKNNVMHLQTMVSKLERDRAVLATGKVVAFDVCVVATGAASRWPTLGRGAPSDFGGDGKRASRLESLKVDGEKLLNAGSVLVVGGGLVGTELAGELRDWAADAGKDLEVHLVQSATQLCLEMSPKAAAMIQRKLEKQGVKVHLNEKAVEKDGKWVLEGSGEVIDAKEVVMTVGISSINSFFDTSSSADAKDDKGFLNTDEYFRVKGMGDKIFSIGDCCTTLPNSGSQILNNIKVLGTNVNVTLKAIKSGSLEGVEKKLKKVTPMKPGVYLATTSTSDGVFYAGGFYTQFLFPRFKNKTMFLFRPKGELGLNTAAL